MAATTRTNAEQELHRHRQPARQAFPGARHIDDHQPCRSGNAFRSDRGKAEFECRRFDRRKLPDLQHDSLHPLRLFTPGGFLDKLVGAGKRLITGESLFTTLYTHAGASGKAKAAFAAPYPGKIVPVYLGEGQQMIAQRTAFLCAEKTVTLDIAFRRKLGAGFFGGEGFVMQRLTGPGIAFVCLDGEIMEYTLGPDQLLKVDTGHVAMYEPTVSFDIEMMKGFRNILFGGEGLFLATLRGPGRIWLQTMPTMNLAKAIAEYLPKTSSSSGSGPSINLGNLLGD